LPNHGVWKLAYTEVRVHMPNLSGKPFQRTCRIADGGKESDGELGLLDNDSHWFFQISIIRDNRRVLKETGEGISYQM